MAVAQLVGLLSTNQIVCGSIPESLFQVLLEKV